MREACYNKLMLKFSRSESDTFSAGAALAKELAGGSIVLLSGFLGAGKTVFVKGVAAALGVTGEVLSPTFQLMREYKAAGGLTLCHIDAYRLKNAAEAVEAGLAEAVGASDTVTCIEWHEHIAELFSGRTVVLVTIRQVNETEREIVIVNTNHGRNK